MDQSQKSAKHFLIIYSIAIFVFAVSLILIASFSYERANREAEEFQKQLTSAELLAADKNTKLDAAMTENSRLKAQIKTLEERVDALTADANTTDAYRKFANIINLDRTGKNKELKAAIEEFEEAGCPALLTPEDLEIYNSIK